MTVVAWDGSMLAADKRAVNSGLIGTTTKIFRVFKGSDREAVLAYTGTAAFGEQMVDWWVRGADPEKFPAEQRSSEDWARLIVAKYHGKEAVIESYERTPFPVVMSDAKQAWGSGRDFALMAMACGRDAAEAVLAAAKFDAYCGNGVDAFYFCEGEIHSYCHIP